MQPQVQPRAQPRVQPRVLPRVLPRVTPRVTPRVLPRVPHCVACGGLGQRGLQPCSSCNLPSSSCNLPGSSCNLPSCEVRREGDAAVDADAAAAGGVGCYSADVRPERGPLVDVAAAAAAAAARWRSGGAVHSGGVLPTAEHAAAVDALLPVPTAEHAHCGDCGGPSRLLQAGADPNPNSLLQAGAEHSSERKRPRLGGGAARRRSSTG